jgi:hypothetical protein
MFVYYAPVNHAAVNREIESVIHPLLRNAGFTEFNARTAWRYSAQKIDVVNFQSLSSSLAQSMGCTTYSFCVRLGCSFDAIPRSERIKRKGAILTPEEYECHFRRALQKTIPQPVLKRRDVWYVDPSGQNLEAVIKDAAKTILGDGLPWFNRFTDPSEILRTLQKDSESHAGTFGFGTKTSPMRHFMTGFVAKSLGKTALATEHIQKVLLSGSLKEFESLMRAALEENNRFGMRK